MRATAFRSINAIIMGAPGGGKGTISKYLRKDWNFIPISTGDILRQNVSKGTDLGKQVESILAEGALVSDELILSMMKEEVRGLNGDLLLDGFPRTIGQAEALKDIVDVDLVINLEIPYEVIVDRISKRWTHLASGRIYSYDFNPPKIEGIDDATGDPLGM
jgi:adenylate kinase